MGDVFVQVGTDTASPIVLFSAQVEDFLAAKSVMSPDNRAYVEVVVDIEDEGSKRSPTAIKLS